MEYSKFKQIHPYLLAAEKVDGIGKSKTSTASLEATVDPQRGSQWLFLCRPQGVIEVLFSSCLFGYSF